MINVLETSDTSLARETMPTRTELLEFVDEKVKSETDTVLSSDRMDVLGYIALARNCLDRLTVVVDQTLLDDITEAAIHGDELASALSWMVVSGDAAAAMDETPSEAILALEELRLTGRETASHIHTDDTHFTQNEVQAAI